MFLSVFDIFKIGIGPSSSHTMGPMVAANRFLEEILMGDWLRPSGSEILGLKVSLHGSLAFTGVGHGTHRAIVLGLCGLAPDSVDADRIDETVERVIEEGVVRPPGHVAYQFRPALDLTFDKVVRLPDHTNGLQFFAYDRNGTSLLHRTYYSIGGGFVRSESEMDKQRESSSKTATGKPVPYPFESADQMLRMASESGLSIAAMKRANEEVRLGRRAVDEGLDKLWAAMDDCIDRGLRNTGILPGGLRVKRRAGGVVEQLREARLQNEMGPAAGTDWLSVFAMAVNEENAAGGRVVTAPTNGAAGVIPAVLKYYLTFDAGASHAVLHDMLLTAAAIGGIIKHKASISGAEVGCQGEVGSASAMAAAAFCAAMRGTPRQVENAAEMALEHHLGMTCDPVAGLVQIPCIERNAFGAVKAIAAASLAMKGDGTHNVSLDVCVETMRQTGRDMSDRYKETSQAGLAVNVIAC